MGKTFTILSLLLLGCFAAVGQASPANQLSGYQRKLKARQDSAQSTADKYFHAGKPKSAMAKDTITPAIKNAPRLAAVDSSSKPDPLKFLPSLDRGSCKGVTFIPLSPDSGDFQAPKTPPPAPVVKSLPPSVPLLQVHGNVLYNLNYYSRIDTPYNEKNIYQHTIQTWLDILIKGQYPFRIFLTNHFSNSSLFRNYNDLNLSYNNSGFSQQIRDQLRRVFLQNLPSQKLIDSLQRVLNTDMQKLKGLEGYGKNPSLIQKAVEDKEAAAARKKPDSTQQNGNALDSVFAKMRRNIDSLHREVARIQELLQSLHAHSHADMSNGLADIQRIDNPAALEKQLPKLGLTDSSLPKGYKTLMAVRSFNIGRTVVNYSELSAKNISVNGFQAEYNPSNYYALATGTVDYRFRDFIVQQPNQPRQYLNIFRVGKGLKDSNSVILTWFMGKRQLFNSATTDSATQVPSSSLMGFTLEGNYHLTKNIVFTGEVAKSTSPSYRGDTTKGDKQGGLFSMGDHSNEAWSAKVAAFFPATQTRFKAAYKHLAANYQSFSIFTDGSSQSAWSANIDQLFFKKQLDIMLGANTNDFTNPFIGQEYRSTTVFKSIQATFRRRNWPTVTVGYFPSSQITKLGNSQYIENLFYTLMGNITDSYKWRQLLMNTTVMYTQFYNRAADSGFTYFNTRNLMVSQTLFLNRFTLQLTATGATNQDYQLYTLEGKGQQSVNKWLALGAGVKYNRQTVYNIDQIGYSAEATLRLDRLGQIQFSADKGFIPGMNKQLVPDNIGRLTYLKTF
ncbi:MAG TPA: hypothetical protein VHE34_28060 [Puia sp.]|uniref:hypothetical protein n=1 Tax=Puia sp. TaxID=2045100 RepID=UPI002BA8DF3C|nr:hypothetical protein [Puia sp.]HVU99122.1 hypothetical protein [Puia sp.]